MFLKSILRLIFALSFFICSNFGFISSALAEPMPESAPVKLQKILEQEEFSGRQRVKSFWDKIKEQILAMALEVLHNIIQKLENLPRPDFVSSISDKLSNFLLRLGDTIVVAGQIALLVLVVLLLVKVLRARLNSTKSKKTIVDSSRDARISFEWSDLEKYYREGKYLELLQGLRMFLREEISLSLNISRTATDREFVKQILAKHLFGDKVFYAFEEQAFALRNVTAEQVSEIFHDLKKARAT